MIELTIAQARELRETLDGMDQRLKEAPYGATTVQIEEGTVRIVMEHRFRER